VRTSRELTEEERVEMEAIAAKYEAGIASIEEMRRAYLLEGYDETWSDYLSKIGGFPTE
jgi:hypothetical protein